ncbi:hypothetical protein BS47DRAFT_1389968 [Hydnum rufescens UP504]|uniref:Uncharacterized protein n=1 Tax=Hydnum rufescens UP504 TaxID=1448309 RepID=A0A9P6B3P7_9AGAM|nr:hypothetical protein BS47DRAFT_1389968 [Hydnum rufescens UP504]
MAVQAGKGGLEVFGAPRMNQQPWLDHEKHSANAGHAKSQKALAFEKQDDHKSQQDHFQESKNGDGWKREGDDHRKEAGDDHRKEGDNNHGKGSDDDRASVNGSGSREMNMDEGGNGKENANEGGNGEENANKADHNDHDHADQPQ